MVTNDNETGKWIVPQYNAPDEVFDAVHMAVAWGIATEAQSRDHSVSVGGRNEDGTIRILTGFCGNYSDMVKWAIDLKDIFLVTKCYVMPIPEYLVLNLRKEEGFSQYTHTQGEHSTAKRPLYPPSTWLHFRNYEHKCRIIPLPLSHPAVSDFEACVVRFNEDMANEKVILPSARKWRDIHNVVKRVDLKDVINHSALRACVYLSETLRADNRPKIKRKPQPPAYGNVPR